MNEELEKRMYFFVPYNISPIQQAIQAGHAALEYAYEYGQEADYLDFVKNWKTWIILNGGTTNNSFMKDKNCYAGSLDNIRHQISKKDINYSIFQEPDLNDALTTVCFICDERVFNYKDYPEFYEWSSDLLKEPALRRMSPEKQKEFYPDHYEKWVANILNGKKNEFLRNLLRGKKLA